MISNNIKYFLLFILLGLASVVFAQRDTTLSLQAEYLGCQ
jgi:hypothetical protein